MSKITPELLADGINMTSVASSFKQLFGFYVHHEDLAAMLRGIYCSASDVMEKCIGLCENSDIAGPGVRASFYAQSLLNAILMAVSPEDAPAACWGAALLTAAVIIPSIMQKRAVEITLHHALIVLGFATMSTIATFASAPFCNFWRAADFPHVLESSRLTMARMTSSSPAMVTSTIPNEPDLVPEVMDESSPIAPTRVNTPSAMDSRASSLSLAGQSDRALLPPEANDFRRVKWNSRNYRSRVMLSVALMTQISFTWTWAVYLFVDPHYAQPPCSAVTNVTLFLTSWEVSWISEKRHRYLLFPGWLLFCMLMSLAWGIALVHTSDIDFPLVERDEILRDPPKSKLKAMAIMLRVFWRWCRRAATVKNAQKRAVIFGNTAAGILWFLLLVNSELQVRANFVFDEASEWGFGQISALLLAAAPLWPITNTFYKYWRAHTESISRPPIETFTASPEQPFSFGVLPPTPGDSFGDLRTPSGLADSSLPYSSTCRELEFERANGPSRRKHGRSASSGSTPPSPTGSISRLASSDADRPDGWAECHKLRVTFPGDPPDALGLDIGSSSGKRPILPPLETGPIIVVTPPVDDEVLQDSLGSRGARGWFKLAPAPAPPSRP